MSPNIGRIPPPPPPPPPLPLPSLPPSLQSPNNNSSTVAVEVEWSWVFVRTDVATTSQTKPAYLCWDEPVCLLCVLAFNFTKQKGWGKHLGLPFLFSTLKNQPWSPPPSNTHTHTTTLSHTHSQTHRDTHTSAIQRFELSNKVYLSVVMLLGAWVEVELVTFWFFFSIAAVSGAWTDDTDTINVNIWRIYSHFSSGFILILLNSTLWMFFVKRNRLTFE